MSMVMSQRAIFKAKVMSLDCFLLPNQQSKPKHFQITVMQGREKKQIFIQKEIWHFCLKFHSKQLIEKYLQIKSVRRLIRFSFKKLSLQVDATFSLQKQCCLYEG